VPSLECPRFINVNSDRATFTEKVSVGRDTFVRGYVRDSATYKGVVPAESPANTIARLI